MPYKSNAQRKYFHAAEARGEVPAKVVKEFDRASKGKKLPEKKKRSKAEQIANSLAERMSNNGVEKEE